MKKLLLTLPALVFLPRLRRWQLHWGATEAELAARMPGDDLVADAQFTATRAITIDAHPEAVWPWLMQVGIGRAGFYSYDFLDNPGHHSSQDILPEWQDVHIGDVAAPMVPDPTPQTSFIVDGLETNHYVVWTKPDSSWSWTLSLLPMGGTRLVTRLRQHYSPDLMGAATCVLLETADFPMMRRMLLGIRKRAEAYDHYPQGYQWPRRAKRGASIS